MSTIMMNLIDRRLQSKICGNDTYLCEVATTWAQNVLEAYENVKAFAGLIKSNCLFKSINCNSHTHYGLIVLPKHINNLLQALRTFQIQNRPGGSARTRASAGQYGDCAR